jgi:serine/threonine-protein kinase
MGSATELGDLVGTTLRGRYELRRVLGLGGMGAVFSGHDLGLERAVAVKVILPRLAADDGAGGELVARFRREARITAGLRHHHVVDVLDFDEDSPTGLLFLVMEHLDGRDLEKVLARERRFPAERAVRVLAQACQAIAHAHRSGQIHRDLKPSNIMLVRRDDEPDFVKVLDFGLARGEDEETKLTATGQVLGTALYMAPEQIDRRRGRVTRSCDLYALGAVAYHLLSGRPPFPGATYAEIFRGHLFDEPTADGSRSQFLRRWRRRRRALAKRVEERYPSVEAFREASSRPSGAGRLPPLRSRPHRPLRERDRWSRVRGPCRERGNAGSSSPTCGGSSRPGKRSFVPARRASFRRPAGPPPATAPRGTGLSSATSAARGSRGSRSSSWREARVLRA